MTEVCNLCVQELASHGNNVERITGVIIKDEIAAVSH